MTEWLHRKSHEDCCDYEVVSDQGIIAGEYGIREEAHARLVSAAPDLLELAKLVHGSLRDGRVITFSDEEIAAFSAAIAKAESTT